MFEKGQIVFCKAGRDKGRFLVVFEFKDNTLWLLDGKRRSVGNAKKKNPNHVSATKTVVNKNVLTSNREIRKVLSSFNDSAFNSVNTKN